VIKELLWGWEWTEFYFMYSWETIWDFLTITATFMLGCYTLYLMGQTLYFARKQTSMIDDMKINMYVKNRK